MEVSTHACKKSWHVRVDEFLAMIYKTSGTVIKRCYSQSNYPEYSGLCFQEVFTGVQVNGGSVVERRLTQIGGQ